MSLGMGQLIPIIALCALCHLTVVLGACTAANAVEFVAIEESQYDRNYSSITEDGKRPLGFMKGSVPYNDATRSNPCVKVTSANGRRIEIMAETDPPTRICVTDQNTENPICKQHKIYDCRQAVADTVVLEFYCDSGCSEEDVVFWYRFTLSTPGLTDPEMWCFNRNTAEYPDSLASVGPVFTPAPPIVTTVSGSHQITAHYTIHLVLAILVLASQCL